MSQLIGLHANCLFLTFFFFFFPQKNKQAKLTPTDETRNYLVKCNFDLISWCWKLLFSFNELTFKKTALVENKFVKKNQLCNDPLISLRYLNFWFFTFWNQHLFWWMYIMEFYYYTHLVPVCSLVNWSITTVSESVFWAEILNTKRICIYTCFNIKIQCV